jgi:8-oxo-dGTP pyrophosphatase MutT (NUDIX family)
MKATPMPPPPRLREAREEIGLDPSNVDVLAELADP